MRTFALLLLVAAAAGAAVPSPALADILPPPTSRKLSKVDSSPSADMAGYHQWLKAAQQRAAAKKAKEKELKMPRTNSPAVRPPAQNKSS